MTAAGPTRDALQLARADLAYHQARVLLLVNAVAGNRGKLDGLTKLAKLDFLVRYPGLAERVLHDEQLDEPLALATPEEQSESEAPMMRYLYGPWDDRYYPVIGALVGRGLLTYAASRSGSVALKTTADGRQLALRLAEERTWADVAERCSAIATRAGRMNGNQLRKLIYEKLPEIMQLPMRAGI
jgi:hypothetical protein